MAAAAAAAAAARDEPVDMIKGLLKRAHITVAHAALLN